MAQKDYYNILGVTKGSSQDEIKKAYRTLAHKYHPDKSGGDEKRFKEVNEAYQVLGDPQRKAQYDQFGTTFEGFSGGQGFDFSQFAKAGGFNFGSQNFEINIEDIFGDFFSSGGARRASKGKDIVIDLEITLDEAFRGTVKEVQVRKFIVCRTCHGNGAEPGTEKKKCETCGGSGEVREAQRTFFGMFSQIRVCQTCNGEGEYPEKVCKECGGDGRIRDVETLSIPIPAGVDDGNVVKINGRGEAARRGGVAGDLIVRVSVRPHNVFKREGAHIYSTLHISFPQAVFGETLEVESIDGIETLTIPRGAQSGSTLVLKGRGMPTGRGARGDHILTLQVETPKKLSSKAKKLIEELKEELE